MGTALFGITCLSTRPYNRRRRLRCKCWWSDHFYAKFQMNKLSHQVAGEWVPHSYPPNFALDSKENARPKILAGIPGGDPAVFARLVECLEPPYFLLYVLHTPRGEADAGRYQSPLVLIEQFREFVNGFGSYLSADARFDIWAHSSAEQATVVWDRHNQVFAYGPTEKFQSVLTAHGLRFFRGICGRFLSSPASLPARVR
jgi:hypothetical protein